VPAACLRVAVVVSIIYYVPEGVRHGHSGFLVVVVDRMPDEAVYREGDHIVGGDVAAGWVMVMGLGWGGRAG